jgi:hypothetical protein
MQFENGESILDLAAVYTAPRLDLEEAVSEFPGHKIGGGAGGGFLFLLFIGITAFCCYKWRCGIQRLDVARQAADMVELANKMAPLTITQAAMYPGLGPMAPAPEKIYKQYGIKRI